MHEIVQPMMEFKEQVKLYHWKTHSYARHKTTDKYLSIFAKQIDKFVEVLLGSRNDKNIPTFSLKFKNINDKNAKEYVESFRDWVRDSLPTMLYEHETDLLNIKDEILADLNRLLYLFNLN